MRDLVAKSPAEGLTPVSIGAITLTEVDLGVLTLLTPFKGQADATSAALEAAHGVALPAVGGSSGKTGAQAIWFGHGQTLLIGPAPDASLASSSAVVDLSDAWTTLTVQGDGVDAALARLAPVDCREAVFKPGDAIRTELAHMMASLLRVDAQTVQIMVFRSMAHTVVHEVRDAMEAVAARR